MRHFYIQNNINSKKTNDDSHFEWNPFWYVKGNWIISMTFCGKATQTNGIERTWRHRQNICKPSNTSFLSFTWFQYINYCALSLYILQLTVNQLVRIRWLFTLTDGEMCKLPRANCRSSNLWAFMARTSYNPYQSLTYISMQLMQLLIIWKWNSNTIVLHYPFE